jgi:hypothetical protein
MPLVIQYNKRDLPNALPVAEIDKDLNKLHAPTFESVATTGLGVEETLKGVTQLVLAHLVKKYGLEGAEPLEKEIQILNAPSPQSAARPDSLWDDDDDPFGSTAAAPPPPPLAPSAAAVAAPRASTSASASVAPANEPEFDLDDDADESIPLVATELVGGSPAPAMMQMNPFDDVTDYYSAPGLAELTNSAPRNASAEASLGSSMQEATEVPTTSIEIPLPAGILDSLPVLGSGHEPVKAVATPPERRATDGLVREVTIPLNLSLEEIRLHRRLRLKITLDVNLLP